MKNCWPKISLFLSAFVLGACNDGPIGEPIYEDVTELSGLQFVHRNGSDGSLNVPAIMGSGVALFDVDNDADLDIYLVQGSAGSAGPDEVWRNDTENDRIRFSRMPDEPVLSSESPGIGVAVGDANLDGRLDVFVTTTGANRLLLNTANGFVAAASEFLSNDRVWSSSAAWLDANVDGRPDLYVGNVAQYDPAIVCRSDTSRPDYCGADAYVPLHDQLLLNFGTTDQGDVIFEDASHDWKLAAGKAPSLGIRVADFNNDGWPDVYVSTFETDNALWLNRAGREFDERALASGVSSDFLGRFRGSVGADAADLDQDNDMDIVVSHHRDEPHQIYLNDGNAVFIANTLVAGGASESHSGAGLVVLDANVDGRDDVFIANGAVRQQQAQLDASDHLPLRESNALLLQRVVSGSQGLSGADFAVTTEAAVDPQAAGKETTPASITASTYADDSILEFDVWEQNAERLTPKPQVSRSVAAGDLDNDGDLDLVITNNDGPTQVLRSTVDPQDWIGINPVSQNTGITLTGTRVLLVQPEVAGIREVRRTHGYLSSSDPRVIFYNVLDGVDEVTIELTWPGGTQERFIVPAKSGYHTLVQGDGET